MALLHVVSGYITINIDPVLVHIGPLAIHWYGLMYVVGIVVALSVTLRLAARFGINADNVYRVFWWTAIAGLIGGRLYFVVQQPNLVSGYLEQPWNIIATWEGGMAFFGAIFLGLPTVAICARVYRLPFWTALDLGAMFAAVGQIFGRIGNIINGDILGYPTTLPWGTIYANPHSFAPLHNVPYQPAAAYEMLLNIILLAILWHLLFRLRRPGMLVWSYLLGYALTQFGVFFLRGTEPIVTLFGLNPGFKQAQWTSLGVMVALIPLFFLIRTLSQPRSPEVMARLRSGSSITMAEAEPGTPWLRQAQSGLAAANLTSTGDQAKESAAGADGLAAQPTVSTGEDTP
jgi:phosphatidylglycerol:prolipoprotein diacylglycerol transferase